MKSWKSICNKGNFSSDQELSSSEDMISTPMVNPAHVTDPEKKLDVAEPSTSNSSRVYQAMSDGQLEL